MISDIYKEDKKVKIRWKYCLFRLMTLYIGYGTKNVVVIKEQKLSIDLLCGATSKEQGWRTVVRALASHQSQWPKFKSWRRRHMWFEFVFGFLSCSKRFFFRVLRFSFLLKNQCSSSKFQVVLERMDTFQLVNILQFTIASMGCY